MAVGLVLVAFVAVQFLTLRLSLEGWLAVGAIEKAPFERIPSRRILVHVVCRFAERPFAAVRQFFDGFAVARTHFSPHGFWGFGS